MRISISFYIVGIGISVAPLLVSCSRFSGLGLGSRGRWAWDWVWVVRGFFASFLSEIVVFCCVSGLAFRASCFVLLLHDSVLFRSVWPTYSSSPYSRGRIRSTRDSHIPHPSRSFRCPHSVPVPTPTYTSSSPSPSLASVPIPCIPPLPLPVPSQTCSAPNLPRLVLPCPPHQTASIYLYFSSTIFRLLPACLLRASFCPASASCRLVISD
ncbi:hypothetical protein DENSPDRAFT_699078 [Dentipellis sp. KUC8613]|nr:hypothetical protein DENSPDRAFT_699078 [Dentipellis sp. KUC8613]